MPASKYTAELATQDTPPGVPSLEPPLVVIVEAGVLYPHEALLDQAVRLSCFDPALWMAGFEAR